MGQYVITTPIPMETKTPWSQSENLSKFYCRAKYVPTPDGGVRLAAVQSMSFPVYGEGNLELIHRVFHRMDEEEEDSRDDIGAADSSGEATPPTDTRRAQRRAKIAAFDYILCNHDLDTFATFTYAPDDDLDRTSYEACYDALRPWLSNRVQRRGLKYVICPERHEKGGIHFHMIANSAALTMERARNANTGRALSHNGNPLYNVTDWPYGFTSAEIIRAGEGDREAVAKYIFKYMGKNAGQRIGGRYFLHGGAMETPFYIYANTVEELCDTAEAKNIRTVSDLPDCPNLLFTEYSFI